MDKVFKEICVARLAGYGTNYSNYRKIEIEIENRLFAKEPIVLTISYLVDTSGFRVILRMMTISQRRKTSHTTMLPMMMEKTRPS